VNTRTKTILVAAALAVATPVNAARILLVGTSIDLLPGTERPGGVWAEELVLPYQRLTEAGHVVELASPQGRMTLDPASLDAEVVGAELSRRVKAFAHLHRDEIAAHRRLATIGLDDYDALFVAGGHGAVWDLAEDVDLRRIAVHFLDGGRPLASVCHGPGFLARARRADGGLALAGYRVTGFSDEEERAIEMDGVVPFSLQQALEEASAGNYSAGPAFESHVVRDRNLVTGQNPASSDEAAESLVGLLGARGAQS
jgi:putative intracellular protease/amidase